MRDITWKKSREKTQKGTDIDGQIPSSLNDQVTNTFENIKKILESEGLNEEHVIKVNIWATEEIDWV
nr:Rid family hydrolase [Bacillus safensis]